MEIYNRTPYIITIVVLVVIALVLGGFIGYDKFVKKDTETKVVTEIDNVSIDLNVFYQISNTLERFDKAFNDQSSNYFGYPYKTKSLAIKDFDIKAAIYASVASDLIKTNTNRIIPDSQVKGNFESMFGKDYIKYKADSVDAGNVKLVYDTSSSSYSYIMPIDPKVYTSGYITENYNTALEEDKVIVTRKVFYVDYPETSAVATSATIYKNSNKLEKLGQVSLKGGTANIKEVMSKYASKLDTYDFTFIANTKENYTLYKIERVR